MAWSDQIVWRDKLQFCYRDGMLIRIKRREFYEQSPSAGGGYYYNRLIWNRASYCGKLSKTAREIIAEHDIPEFLPKED